MKKDLTDTKVSSFTAMAASVDVNKKLTSTLRWSD